MLLQTIGQKHNKKMEAMSLIEMSFVLIIMGVLLVMGMQGWTYVEQVRLHDVSQKILRLKVASEHAKGAHMTTESALSILESYGCPKAKDNKINMGSYGTLSCVSINPLTCSIENIKKAHAKKIINILNTDMQSEEDFWLKIEDSTDEKITLTIRL